jgi:hypothetical protein
MSRAKRDPCLTGTTIDIGLLVGVPEIADMANVTRAAVHNWKARHGDFPDPVVRLSIGDIYDRREVQAWLNQETVAVRRFSRGRRQGAAGNGAADTIG